MKSSYKKYDVLKLCARVYNKRFHPKSPFHEKMKTTTKKTVILKSFIIVCSFDCNRTFMNMLHANVIITIVHLVIVEDLEGSIGG
jgi:hypothetical protein